MKRFCVFFASRLFWNWNPNWACRDVKIGFSLLCSPLTFKFALQLVQRKFGLVHVNVARLTKGAARAPTMIVSALPRTLESVYWKFARGPLNVRSLVLNVEGNPTGGNPGSATVPAGMLPPRLTISNPKP